MTEGDPSTSPPAGERDWFGNPIGPRDGERWADRPTCPLCREPVDDRADLAVHLSTVHGVAPSGRQGPGLGGRTRRWGHSLGYLPLWFVLLLTVGLVAVTYLAVSPIDSWLGVYAAALASLPLVLVLSFRLFSRRDGY